MTPHFDQNKFLRLKHTKNYNTARNVFLLSCILTAVSLILVVLLEVSFTFSAYLPVSFMASGKLEYDIDNGVYTAEELGVTEEELIAYQELSDGTIALVSSAIPAVIITGCLFLCWALSKKHSAWMIIATVLYGVDALIMLPDLFLNFALDASSWVFRVIFYAWILYYLINGSISASKLKKLPAPIEGEAVELKDAVDNIVLPSAEKTVPAESDDSSPEV